MLLDDYDHPNEHEMEAAFREIYHFSQKLTLFERFIISLLLWKMGDRFYRLVAQRLHQKTMGTLREVTGKCHTDFFKQDRLERAEIKRRSKGWVKSTVIE